MAECYVQQLARNLVARAAPALLAKGLRAASPICFNQFSTSQIHGSQLDGRSVDPSEVAKFAAVADKWWDMSGPFAPLHAMTTARVAFVRSILCRHFARDPNVLHPLEGLRILDVGCGGGLLAEPLARLGGHVTGIDVTPANISVARKHKELDPTMEHIHYKCMTAEHLAEEGERFDAVIALEVVEHVDDPLAFVRTLTTLCAAHSHSVTHSPSPTSTDATLPLDHLSWHASMAPNSSSGTQSEATAHVARAAGHALHHVPSDPRLSSGVQSDTAERGVGGGRSEEGATKRDEGPLPSCHPQQHSGTSEAPLPTAADAAADAAAAGGAPAKGTGGGGVVVLSTLNRTARSYALAIVAAEHVLSMVPPGTHDWRRFISPFEMALMLRRAGFQMTSIAGMELDPLRWQWHLTSDKTVNYIAAAVAADAPNKSHAQ